MKLGAAMKLDAVGQAERVSWSKGYTWEENALRFEELFDELLEHAGVAVLPGELYGRLGKDHIALSFATPEENINEGITRLKESL